MEEDKILFHKDSYTKGILDGSSGKKRVETIPGAKTNSIYNVFTNNDLSYYQFGYDVGSTIRNNIAPGDGSGGGISPDHNHDDRYSKLGHNHDDRYYTKLEVDEWRDRLINGDLLFGKINARHIQAGTIVAGNSIIADGAIGSAQISKVSADKIDAGIIDTARVTIQGANGNLKLSGNRLQVFEGIGTEQYERVSLGDVDNDGSLYGLRVRGKDGVTVLYDENGVYREGITDGSINNDKIGGDANIDGGKLNISSVITKINEDDTTSIEGVKINVDGKDVSSALYSINMTQDEHSETIQRQQAEIKQNKENIKLKVDNQQYTEDSTEMKSKLEKTNSEINLLKDGLSLKAEKTEVVNQIGEVKDFVSNEIDDISVGGVNYLNNSAPRKATVIPDVDIKWDITLNGKHKLVHWRDYVDDVPDSVLGYHAHIDLNTFHFPCIAFINKNETYGHANRWLGITQDMSKIKSSILPGQYYTISFDAYSDSPLFTFRGGLKHYNKGSDTYGYNSKYMVVQIPMDNVGKWVRYYFTFETNPGFDSSRLVEFEITGHNNLEASGYIKNIKFEDGNKGTQYTLSQFDVDESLDDVVKSSKEYTNESIKTYSSSIDIQLDNITSRVELTEQVGNDLKRKYTEIKQTVDSIDVTGKVNFSDLYTPGRTTISGSNITTGVIDTGRVNIKGQTTRKIVLANDNYCVYDGEENDVNRKVFIGFRRHSSTVNVPSIILGYNGVRPDVDGSVVSGGTYTTYSHYKNIDNPEGLNLSYGALAFKYNSAKNDICTLNMYQNGEVGLQAGTNIYLRAGKAYNSNAQLVVEPDRVYSRKNLSTYGSFFAQRSISTDENMYARVIRAPSMYTNRFYFDSSGHLAFGKNDYNNNMMNGTNWDWQGFNIVNAHIYSARMALPTYNQPRPISLRQKRSTEFVNEDTDNFVKGDTLSEIGFRHSNVINLSRRMRRDTNQIGTNEVVEFIDINNVSNKDEITHNGSVELVKLVFLLVKEVQKLKNIINKGENV